MHPNNTILAPFGAGAAKQHPSSSRLSSTSTSIPGVSCALEMPEQCPLQLPFLFSFLFTFLPLPPSLFVSPSSKPLLRVFDSCQESDVPHLLLGMGELWAALFLAQEASNHIFQLPAESLSAAEQSRELGQALKCTYYYIRIWA